MGFTHFAWGLYSPFSLICTAHVYDIVLVRVSLQSTDFRLYVLVSGGEAAPENFAYMYWFRRIATKNAREARKFFEAP